MALNLPALFKDVEPQTLKFGVVGWPLSHTLSPAMQTAAIRALHIDAVYRAVPAPPDEWALFLTQAKALPLTGFNITVPYKETILQKGEHAVPWGGAASDGEVGAANTVSRSKAGWKAFNTDVGGLQDDLVAQGVSFDGRNAVILGSGGAARAAVVALAGLPKPPTHIWVLNRTLARAQELARQFSKGSLKVHAAPLDEGAAAIKGAALLLNATSMGLAPDDPCPIDPRRLHDGLLVYDMIYHRETALLKAARAAGARAVGGLGMLVRQGARSFEIWFNRKPSIDVMREAAQEELKRRQTT